MVQPMKMAVEHVMMIAQMTVYKIVAANGEAMHTKMIAVYVMMILRMIMQIKTVQDYVLAMLLLIIVENVLKEILVISQMNLVQDARIL